MSLSNSLGLLGRKVGMMRLFTDDAVSYTHLTLPTTPYV